MSASAIVTERIGKKYTLGEKQLYKTFRERLAGIPAHVLGRGAQGHAHRHIWALKDVDMQIAQGEVVGIIGPNGSGKSTLLKILSRITDPTEGKATIRGRVGALLEVGTGFHPELTGRENVYVNGAILGMSQRDIDRKLDAIVDFSGVEEFFDTPVKRYSSGMRVRLAFAVAAHLEPHILFIDEVLAVGDAAFQRKCLAQVDATAKEGRTVLFVTHQLEAMEALCSRAIWLRHGRVIADGEPRSIVGSYLREVVRSDAPFSLEARSDRAGTGALRFKTIGFASEGGLSNTCRCGENVVVRMSYVGETSELKNVKVQLWIRDNYDRKIALLWTSLTNQTFDVLPCRGAIICKMPRLALAPGTYTMDLTCEANSETADDIRNAFRFEVMAGNFFLTGRSVTDLGQFLVAQDWASSSTE
jgi:lipopolysaccharide transport system ATP-binding protein